MKRFKEIISPTYLGSGNKSAKPDSQFVSGAPPILYAFNIQATLAVASVHIFETLIKI